MLIADLRLFLENKFVQVFDEFVPLCANAFQTASFLSNLFWWSEVAEKTPEKQGWVYKTAENLKKELSLTRRGYEKARRILLQNGLVQYRRGGVHGKMHWYINREVLLAKICELRGVAVPEASSKYHYDRDNFRLSKVIPLDLWQSFLDGVIASGRKVNNKKKIAWQRMLLEFHGRKLDLRPIMELAINNGWVNFYADEKHSVPQPSKKEQYQQIEQFKQELKQQLDEREAQPPPDKTTIFENSGYRAIQDFLRKNGHKK